MNEHDRAALDQALKRQRDNPEGTKWRQRRSRDAWIIKTICLGVVVYFVAKYVFHLG